MKDEWSQDEFESEGNEEEKDSPLEESKNVLNEENLKQLESETKSYDDGLPDPFEPILRNGTHRYNMRKLYPINNATVIEPRRHIKQPANKPRKRS